MTFDIAIVLVVIGAAVVLFVTEKLSIDLVALLAVGALVLTRVLSPEEAVSGFSNQATVTIAAMFVLSAGLGRTGLLESFGGMVARLAKRDLRLATLAMMGVAAAVSAFVNNTAVVVILMPIVLVACRQAGAHPGQMLMPLSFATVMGGCCSLIGTSTSLVVDSIVQQAGLPAIGMFEFSAVGVILLAAGMIYMATVGIRMLPRGQVAGGLTGSFGLTRYLVEAKVREGSPLEGRDLAGSPLLREADLTVLQVIRREGDVNVVPKAHTVLHAGDVLQLRADLSQIQRLSGQLGIDLLNKKMLTDADLQTDRGLLIEAVVPPGSPLAGKSLRQARFRHKYDANVLAIRHRGEPLHDRLADLELQSGDVLLLELRRERLPDLEASGTLILLSEVTHLHRPNAHSAVAFAIMIAVVALAAADVVPIVAGSLLGAVAMVVTRCLRLEEAYQAIEWKVLVMLGGLFSLGIALQKSGADQLLARSLVGSLGDFGPLALLAAIYFATSLMTELMSNNATVALLTPVALSVAEVAGVDPRAFVMAVLFAASNSFMTPIGYQTNTLVFGPGEYRFKDFLKVGTPINLMFWLLATLLLPWFWPF
jgi:di/tricarboxylate transporter